MPTTKDFKLEELSKYFHMPEKAVAKELGICLTSLKKLCRSYGITRWPFRKLKSIQRTLAKVQDETSPGMASQIQTAGIGQEASKDAPKPVPVADTAHRHPRQVGEEALSRNEKRTRFESELRSFMVMTSNVVGGQDSNAYGGGEKHIRAYYRHRFESFFSRSHGCIQLFLQCDMKVILMTDV
eukprot:752311-Hanusia_phi.AAC.4